MAAKYCFSRCWTFLPPSAPLLHPPPPRPCFPASGYYKSCRDENLAHRFLLTFLITFLQRTPTRVTGIKVMDIFKILAFADAF